MKTALIIFLSAFAMTTGACTDGNTAKTPPAVDGPDKQSKTYVARRVQDMQAITDLRLIYSPEFYAVEHRAELLPDFMEGYRGFDWNGKVFDVCNPDKVQLRNVDLKFIDSTHADAEMTYFDPGCYSIRYKLHLLFVGDEWMIDDVTWMNEDELSGSERDMAQQYINETAQHIAGLQPDELMASLNEMVPDWQYDNEDFIYHDNPQAVNDLTDAIKMVKECYRSGTGYTPQLGSQIDALIQRVRDDARRHGVKL